MPDPTPSLLDALLAVQAEVSTLRKDGTATVQTKKGGSYTYTYISLDTIVEQVGPILNAHKLVWSTKPSFDDASGEPTLKYTLAHAPSGDREEGEMKLLLIPEARDPQGQGSAITYARRYALCSVLNLVADDDDDGAGASRQSQGERAGGTNGKAGRPSDKQVEFLQSLVKQKKPTVAQLKVMLAELGAEGIEIEEGWASRLTGGKEGQASALIERLKSGDLPVIESSEPPRSDVPEPAAGEFEHPGTDLEGTPFATHD